MEAESRLSDSFRARNLKAGRVLVGFCHVSKVHARVKSFAKWTSLFSFPSLFIFLHGSYAPFAPKPKSTRGHFGKKVRISQSRGWLSPKDIVNIHTVYRTAYACYIDRVSRNAATSRERSQFMASPSIRGTLNLSQLTP